MNYDPSRTVKTTQQSSSSLSSLAILEKSEMGIEN
jgi:hypothetical protein